MGALSLVGALSNVNGLFVENMWLFYLLTPIPITSIIFGFVLKSKGYKYRKNIIVGFIMTFFLCIYGSFTFMFYWYLFRCNLPLNWTWIQFVSRFFFYSGIALTFKTASKVSLFLTNLFTRSSLLSKAWSLNSTAINLFVKEGNLMGSVHLSYFNIRNTSFNFP